MSSEFNFYDANLDNLEKYSDCDDEDWNQLPPNTPKSNKIAIDSFNGNHFVLKRPRPHPLYTPVCTKIEISISFEEICRP